LNQSLIVEFFAAAKVSPQQDHAWGVWYKVETGGLFGWILDVTLVIDARLSISVCVVGWRRRVTLPTLRAGNVGKCGYYGLTGISTCNLTNKKPVANRLFM
jgi:hypothetical protein